MFNVQYDDLATIQAIRKTALANLVAGITITEFVSEGTQFKGQVTAADTRAVLLATERYLDEYQGELITETTPNFLSFP